MRSIWGVHFQRESDHLEKRGKNLLLWRLSKAEKREELTKFKKETGIIYPAVGQKRRKRGVIT